MGCGHPSVEGTSIWMWSNIIKCSLLKGSWVFSFFLLKKWVDFKMVSFEIKADFLLWNGFDLASVTCLCNNFIKMLCCTCDLRLVSRGNYMWREFAELFLSGMLQCVFHLEVVVVLKAICGRIGVEFFYLLFICKYMVATVYYWMQRWRF